MMTYSRILTIVLTVLAPVTGFADDRLEGLEFRHGISFYHDLKYPADYTHLEYLQPDAPKGGALVLPTQSSFDTLSPFGDRGTGDPGGAFRYETLIIRAGDEVSAFYGRLADGIAVTDDRLTLVFRIHPQAKWHDGVPVTAKDVVYTLGVRRGTVHGRMQYDFIESIDEIDDRHVALHLTEPVKESYLAVIRFISILPEHYWRDKDPTASTMVPPLNSGPYKINAFKQGRYIQYQRVPDYWGRNIPVNRGRYNFDTIRFEVYRDATVAREAFRKGLVDIWDESDARYWHSAFDTPAFEKGWVKKIRRNWHRIIGVRQIISLNNRSDKFRDRRVRQALTLAVDFEWQNRALHYGYHHRAHSYWPDTVLAATGLPSDDELSLLELYRGQLPEDLFERPFRFPDNTTPEQRRTSLVKARALFAEAGWRIDDGVLRNAAGEAFEISFLSQNAADARVLIPYFKQLERLGVRGAIDMVGGASQFAYRIRSVDFDATLKPERLRMPPVYGLRGRYHSDSALTFTVSNVAGVSNPVLDHLVDEARAATTMAQVIAACRAIDRVLLWEYYSIPLYAVEQPRTVLWDKFGRPDFEPKYEPAFPDGWWYEQEKAARIVDNRQ